MNIMMWPKSKWTGNSYKIVDKTINSRDVVVDNEFLVKISIPIGPIQTSGDFKGVLSISLAELHSLVGIVEEKKLERLLKKIEKSVAPDPK